MATKEELEELWRKEGAPGLRLPPVRDIRVARQESEALQRINRVNRSTHNAVDLKGANELFVQKMLRAAPNHPEHRDPQFLLEISCQKTLALHLKLQRRPREQAPAAACLKTCKQQRITI